MISGDLVHEGKVDYHPVFKKILDRSRESGAGFTGAWKSTARSVCNVFEQKLTHGRYYYFIRYENGKIVVLDSKMGVLAFGDRAVTGDAPAQQRSGYLSCIMDNDGMKVENCICGTKEVYQAKGFEKYWIRSKSTESRKLYFVNTMYLVFIV